MCVVTLRVCVSERCYVACLFLCVCVYVRTVSSPGLKTFNPTRSSSAQKLMSTNLLVKEYALLTC